MNKVETGREIPQIWSWSESYRCAAKDGEGNSLVMRWSLWAEEDGARVEEREGIGTNQPSNSIGGTLLWAPDCDKQEKMSRSSVNFRFLEARKVGPFV